MIASCGQLTSSGWLRETGVLNGYSGVYAYLGQYFDQAYQIDSNGNLTTDSAGILSPYGNFFAYSARPGGISDDARH